MENSDQKVVALVRSESSTAVQTWSSPEWDAARIELARKTIASTATPLEFEFFIGWCKRTGLDPFLKQAFMIERKSKDARGNWIVKHEPMASESGMAARVDAMPDYQGMEAAAVYDGDVFAIVDGHVKHEWSPITRKAKGMTLLGAWAHLRRAGRVTQVTWLPLESRIQMVKDYKTNVETPNRFWKVMPEGQIVKCARAEQYRLGYPNVFGGVYIREEMPDSGGEERDATPLVAKASPPVAAISKTAEVAERVERLLGKPLPETAAGFETEAETDKPKPEPVPITKFEKPEPVMVPEPGADEEEPGPKLGFNPDGFPKLKGAALASLTAVQLTAAISTAEAKLKVAPKAPYAKKLGENLAELKAEQEDRINNMEAQS